MYGYVLFIDLFIGEGFTDIEGGILEANGDKFGFNYGYINHKGEFKQFGEE
jgi:hypothetical protein